MTEEKVLIINTGGTISMVPSDKNNPESALRPSKSWNEVVKNYQFLKNLNVGYAQIKDVIDSSDMNCEVWKEIAEIIDTPSTPIAAIFLISSFFIPPIATMGISGANLRIFFNPL